MSSLCGGHVNLLWIVPILVCVLPKTAGTLLESGQAYDSFNQETPVGSVVRLGLKRQRGAGIQHWNTWSWSPELPCTSLTTLRTVAVRKPSRRKKKSVVTPADSPRPWGSPAQRRRPEISRRRGPPPPQCPVWLLTHKTCDPSQVVISRC